MERIGIDISEEKFDVCIRSLDSKQKATFSMDRRGMQQFQRWLQRYTEKTPELWMEATGRYYEGLAEWAHKLGWKIVIANPRSVRHFAVSKLKVSKTDPLDAEIILRFAETSELDEFHYWEPKSGALKNLRDLQVEIRGLKKAMVQEQNRLQCGLQSPFVRESIKQTLAFLQNQIKRLQQESMSVIKADVDLLRIYSVLKPIKGFGDVTIALMIWKIDFDAFKKGRQLVKYAGLDSVAWQSGKSKRPEHISKVGHAELRSGLFLPALTAMTHDPETVKFANKLKASGACKKTIACAVMARLLRVAFARVRDSRKLGDLHAS
jgi:transposase